MNKIMNKIIIVVDMQNDFVTGSLGFNGAVAVKQKLAEYLESVKDMPFHILATRDTHNDDYLETLEGQNLRIKHCIRGTAGHDIVDELKPFIKDENVFDKETFMAVRSLLPQKIRTIIMEEPIDEIIITGLVTSICVLNNVLLLRGLYPNIQITVPMSMTDDPSPQAKRAAKTIMEYNNITIIE